MENWKITREDAIDWGATLLLALPLCFFALANWPQQPEGTLACYLREWGAAGIVLLCYFAVRGVRVWRQNATQRRQSLRAGGLELLVGSTYFAVVAAGGALLWAFRVDAAEFLAAFRGCRAVGLSAVVRNYVARIVGG